METREGMNKREKKAEEDAEVGMDLGEAEGGQRGRESEGGRNKMVGGRDFGQYLGIDGDPALI